MRVLTAALMANPLSEHIKVTVFMDDLKVGPARTQLFRVHANTMVEAIQIALQEEYSHRQARTPATAWQGNSAPGSAQDGSPGNGATSGPVPMELGLAEPRYIRCFGCGRLGHMKRVCPARGQQKPSFGKFSGSKGRVQQPRHKRQGNSRKSSDRLLVVHGRVRGHEYPFRTLIDSGASKNFARRLPMARNTDKFADALRENSGAGPVSVRLANGSLVEVPRVLMDLSVKFEDFDSTDRFIALEMDKYDLILGIRWLDKHGPWIDWRGKAIGASRLALSDRALVSHVPTSIKSKGVRQDHQAASASKEFMGVAEVFGVPQEVTVDSVKESAEAPPGVKPSEPREASRLGWASCPACGATKSVDSDTGGRRVVRASTDNMLRAAHQVDNLVPPEQGTLQREPSVDASCVGNIVPHKASMADDARDEASSDVGNIVPRRGWCRRRRHRKSDLLSQTGVAQGDSEPEASQTLSSDGHYHVFDSETGLRVKADAVQLEALPEVAELLNLEEMSLDDFLAGLKTG
ncbi:unnamed protein product [Phytophthora fragariaefolia]|uniref:Unnamed protein product n=1 Tax=Phytophthora fragariaefolia TaxID=1490495 RepID=A0A9W6YQ24_9STRA|nr:unnamed protein product [Phytophthora fragariaefolia]